MPKGHKRKNTGVGVDFKRAKHKVGKKLPQAQNATDTTIVSRSIALKEQSIAVDKTGAVVTHRNLTLKVRRTPFFFFKKETAVANNFLSSEFLTAFFINISGSSRAMWPL
jgi:hypothetical protein